MSLSAISLTADRLRENFAALKEKMRHLQSIHLQFKQAPDQKVAQ